MSAKVIKLSDYRKPAANDQVLALTVGLIAVYLDVIVSLNEIFAAAFGHEPYRAPPTDCA